MEITLLINLNREHLYGARKFTEVGHNRQCAALVVLKELKYQQATINLA